MVASNDYLTITQAQISRAKMNPVAFFTLGEGGSLGLKPVTARPGSVGSFFISVLWRHYVDHFGK